MPRYKVKGTAKEGKSGGIVLHLKHDKSPAKKSRRRKSATKRKQTRGMGFPF